MRFLFAALLCAAVTACPSPQTVDPDAGTPADASVPDASMPTGWAACAWAGEYRVASIDRDAGACADLARAGERIAIERTGVRDGFLLMGRARIPVAVDAMCKLAGSGCGGNDGGLYAQATVSASYVQLQWGGERIVNHSLDPCPASATLALVPVEAGCDLEGPWRLDAGIALASGVCNTSWPGGLSIARADGGYRVSVGGQDFGVLSNDAGACALQATRGHLADGGASDFWLFNSVMRRATVTLVSNGTTIDGTIDDALSGPSGSTHCPGGTFRFTAARPTLGTDTLNQACEARPFLRGNSQCETDAGEDCFEADCACTGGKTCNGAKPARCQLPCGYFTEGCPTGERCDSTYPSTQGFCAPAGTGVDRSTCGSESDCAAGLSCLWGRSLPPADAGVCARKCKAFMTACAATEACVESTPTGRYSGCETKCDAMGQCDAGTACRFVAADGTNVVAAVCLPVKGVSDYGQPCGAGCPSNQICSTVTASGVMTSFCVPKCTTSANCPADFPRCSLGACSIP